VLAGSEHNSGAEGYRFEPYSGVPIGHSDTDVTGRHDKHAYDQEKREALTRWADELLRIVADKGESTKGQVLPWARR
jgi:hypothetical protein